MSSPASSPLRAASPTIWLSGTVLTTSPRTKICPLPFPDDTPRSASRASPGPFTTHPITATRSGVSKPSNAARHLLGQPVHVHLRPPARRARHDLQPPRPQAQRLQDGQSDLDLLHRRRGQRHPDRVADAVGEQHAERHRRLDRALETRPRLGDAEVQRVVAPRASCRYAAIITTGSWCFTDSFRSVNPCSSNSEHSHSADSTSASGVALPYFGEQPRVERARVHADADRHAGVARRAGDLGRPGRRTS